MRKLAIDFGTKTCGFAISDELGIIASPLEDFTYTNNDYAQILDRVKYWQAFYMNKIDVIVLGLPLNVKDGSDNQRTILVRDFFDYMQTNWQNGPKIVLFDERFTTRIATQYLKNINLKNSQIKKIKDKMSAVVILTDYLKTQNF